jgi:hypothetical protein
VDNGSTDSSLQIIGDKFILLRPSCCSILLVKISFYKNNQRFGFSPGEGRHVPLAKIENSHRSGFALHLSEANGAGYMA